MQLLRFMHRIWAHSGIDYQLFLVEQSGDGKGDKK